MPARPARRDPRTLQTERLTLGPVTVDDAGIMLAIWNDPAFIRNVSDKGIRTLSEAREAIVAGPEQTFAEHGYGPYCLALKSDAARIGICGLFKRDYLEHPDIGFALLPDWVGQGYAREAAEEIIRHAREDLGLNKLHAIVSPANDASVGLIRRLGLTYERDLELPDSDDAAALYGRFL